MMCVNSLDPRMSAPCSRTYPTYLFGLKVGVGRGSVGASRNRPRTTFAHLPISSRLQSQLYLLYANVLATTVIAQGHYECW